MNATLTPLDMGKALARHPRVHVPHDGRERLRATLRRLALRPVGAERETEQSTDAHAVRFKCLLEEAPRVSDIIESWKAVLEEGLQLTASEAVLFEFYFSSGSALIVPRLPRDLKYLKTLQIIRERASIALHDYARDINWSRPVLFAQGLKVARGYLRDVVGRAELTRKEFRSGFSGRVGVATVLIGRFEPIDRQDAAEAVAALRDSLEQGNSPKTAVPYLLEAATQLFDTGGDVSSLQTILKEGREWLPRKKFERNAAAQLAACDIYLRLASQSTGPNRLSALNEAGSSIENAARYETTDDEKVAARLMAVLVAELKGDPGLLDEHSVVGLRLPFGIRTPAEAPSIVRRFVSQLVEAIASLASSGIPLARGVSADLLELASSSPIDAGALRRTVDLRAGNRQFYPLADERSRLLSLRDRLLIASITVDHQERAAAITELILMSVTSPTSPTPVLLIAQDIEINGSVDLPSRTADRGSQIARAALAGDWKALMRLAASLAWDNPDLSVTPLGGRSGVTTLGDYYGLVGQTFVFKELRAIALRREESRAVALAHAIIAAGRASEYLLSEHLDSVPVAIDMVRSVRRFVPGRSVLLAASAANRDKRIELLSRTASYLGFMNTVEEATVDGVRKEMKERELGRWVRAIEVSAPMQHFGNWWALVSNGEMVRRRDAHLDNWVITTDDRLLALDLEAIGCRPVGYELAQITDDRVIFDPKDWDARRAVFDSYRASRGATRARDAEWATYEASLAARSLRTLTWSEAAPEEQEHARALLEEIVAEALRPELRRWAQLSLDAWRRRRGLAGMSSGELTLDRHRRRRVSKAMAYHLRHGATLDLDPDGWASLAELSKAIGFGVSETEIAIVASTLSEPRFEFRDEMVRARYGHTRRIAGILRTTGAVSDVRVYHATNLASARLIIECAEGLKPMERQFVHLSKDRSEALRSGLRHGAPLLLSANASQIDGAMAAAGNTVVAPAVGAASLRVEPISSYWELVPYCRSSG